MAKLDNIVNERIVVLTTNIIAHAEENPEGFVELSDKLFNVLGEDPEGGEDADDGDYMGALADMDVAVLRELAAETGIAKRKQARKLKKKQLLELFGNADKEKLYAALGLGDEAGEEGGEDDDPDPENWDDED